MLKAPWLTIIGVTEDGPDGLSPASSRALEAAEVVMGPPRHLSLLPNTGPERIEWPVPFADGLTRLESVRGRQVVVLVSGDPFWFGAGTTLSHAFPRDEWQVIPAPSTFSLAAARMRWALEHVVCLGLHASPLTRLRPHLAQGVRALVLLRDGEAVAAVAEVLRDAGFGESRLTILEALGGPRERVTPVTADEVPDGPFVHPVAVAIEVAGTGAALPRASGIDDAFFESDGQITKRPVRALALSALAPKPLEKIWDIGGGSGSIAIEWLLAHPTTEAVCIEERADRAARIRTNADRLGVDRLSVVEGAAPSALDGLPEPDAVFIGGGLSEALLADLTGRLRSGTRLVAHAVTLESEALLADWSAPRGGSLLRIELTKAAPLGSKRGWKGAYPIVQWQVTL
ncbi:MAG: precorrin-6y C5,15-methyltransferase (decarboxylating) subunit CbiE [Pseudomonadota bacterium]